MTDLAQSIRAIPDYPKPGIIFRDITAVLGDARAFGGAVDTLLVPFVGTMVGKVVILVNDLIATGGTAEAATKLLQSLGADVVAAVFVVDLPDLGGRKKIEALGVPVHTLVAFDGH